MLTGAQRSSLDQDGFIVLRDILTVDLVARWRDAWYALKADIANGRSTVQRTARFVLGELPEPLSTAYQAPPLVEVAHDLMGPDLALYYNRILVKDAQWNGPVQMHQDMPYFNGGQRKIAAFVPLEPCTQAHGALKLVVGSHKYGNLGVRGVINTEDFAPMPVAEPDLMPGDALFHDFHVWHFSETGTAPGDRPLMQIAYQPADDGSYYGQPDQATLVAGRWRTKHFVKLAQGITPDVPATAQPPEPITDVGLGCARLAATLDFARARDALPAALSCSYANLDGVAKLAAQVDVTTIVAPDLPDGMRTHNGIRLLSPVEAAGAGIGTIIAAAEGDFRILMRHLEPASRAGLLVLPMDPDWAVPAALRAMSAMETAWNTTPDANYVSRSGLRGHYLEFGTFWGSSFFPAYFRLRDWLGGNFYAFDSFAGLSPPLAEETELTPDFVSGTYCCNQRSFQALADLLAVPAERMRVVPGFYADTLGSGAAQELGLLPGSVSVCVIDCDLYEPTLQALDFVTPLMETGGLIYFDDWRLCRASPDVGERAAALAWLARHPEIELVELHREIWQHQWFILQRKNLPPSPPPRSRLRRIAGRVRRALS